MKVQSLQVQINYKGHGQCLHYQDQHKVGDNERRVRQFLCLSFTNSPYCFILQVLILAIHWNKPLKEKKEICYHPQLNDFLECSVQLTPFVNLTFLFLSSKAVLLVQHIITDFTFHLLTQLCQPDKTGTCLLLFLLAPPLPKWPFGYVCN